MVWAVITLLIFLGVLLSICIAAAFKYFQLYRLQQAIENAWFPAGVCNGREDTADCKLHADDNLPPPPTQILQPQFNRKLARRLADYVCRIELVEGTHVDAPPKHKQVAVYKPRSGPAFGIAWTYERDTLIIAFRCTITHSEVQDDLMAWQVDFDTGKVPIDPADENTAPDTHGKRAQVHSGFHDVFKRYRGEVLDTVHAQKPKIVLICGHSLGGAVATLMSLYVAENVKDIEVGCYVFGTPRVGNPKFDDRLRAAHRLTTLWRVANQADVIQTLPLIVTPNFRDPSQNPLYYQHAGPTFEYLANWGSWRTNHAMQNYTNHVS